MDMDEMIQRVIAGGYFFEPKARLEISDGVEVKIERKNDSTKDFFKPVGYIIQSDSEFQYRWDNISTDTIVPNDDLTLSSGTVHGIIVPFGLLEEQKNKVSIFLHLKQTVSTPDSFIKYVEV